MSLGWCRPITTERQEASLAFTKVREKTGKYACAIVIATLI